MRAAAGGPGAVAAGRDDDEGDGKGNEIKYFDNVWPGKDVKLENNPFKEAKFTYPPMYVAAWKADDEKVIDTS